MAPMLIFAEEFQSDALTALVVNKLQLGLRIAAIKAPLLSGKEILEDIGAFSGASVMGDR